MIYDINPLRINNDRNHQKFLGMLFNQHKGKVFEKNTLYPFINTENNTEEYICLTHTVIKDYKRIGKRKLPRYYLLDKDDRHEKIGEGNSGSAYNELGKLRFDENNQLEFLPPQRRKKYIIKVQEHSFRNSPNKAKKEAEALSVARAKKRKAAIKKTPLSFHAESYIRDEKFGTNDLSRVKADFNSLCQISINLLHQANEFHKKAYAHGDITPDNTRFDKFTNAIRLIDFGSSTKIKNIPRLFHPANANYCAPEKIGFWRYAITEKSDFYSIGLTLLKLWGGHGRLCDIFDIFLDNQDRIDLDSIPEQPHKNEVIAILQGLLWYNPANRTSLEETILAFKKLQIIERYGANDKDKIFYATEAAANLKQEIEKVGGNDQDKINLYFNLVKLHIRDKNLINEYVVIEQFIEALNIKAFTGLNSKKMLLDKTNAIMTDYHFCVAHFKAIHDKLIISTKLVGTPSSLDSAIFYLDKILYRYQADQLNLDNMEKFIKSCYQNLPIIIEKLNEFDRDTTPAKEQMSILDRLHFSDSKSPIEIRKNAVRRAIRSYMLDTYTPDTILAKDRAASQRRTEDMHKILDALEQNIDEANLKNSLIQCTSNIKTGFFGRSALRDKVNEAMNLQMPRLN